MKNTITTLSLATLLTLSSSAVMAGDKYRHYEQGGQDRAKVTWVEPVYNEVRVTTPVRECYESRDYRRGPQQSYTGTIAGGLIGGVIGNQFGGGNGQTAMTVAGALLGGSVGRDMSNQYRGGNSDYRGGDYGYSEQCDVRYEDRYEQRVEGYEVGYRYKGREYTTFMDHHPGKFIPVEVTARPTRRYY